MSGAERTERWSTATRLTAAAAVVIAVVLAAGAVGTVLALRDTLLSSLDRNAHDDAADVAQHYSPRTGGGSAAALPAPEPDAVVQIVDADGRVVAASAPELGRPVVPAGRGAHVASVTAIGRLPLAQTADAYHVAALRTADGSTVLVALPSDDVTDAVHQLTIVLLVGVPILFVLLLALSWVVVGRALAPVQQMQRRQRAFVADAAHELRTPLASLRAQLETGHPGVSADEERQLVHEVTRLTELVDALLALARVDEHRLTITDVDLDDLVFTVVRRHRCDDGVATDVSGVHAARVRGDAKALELLVDNLVSNAVRHAASSVAVTLTADRGMVVLTVADDGPGIPAAESERVFERFARLETARSRAGGGVGLGLAIVKAVAQAHGGTVAAVDNAPGARMLVHIPAGGATR